MQLQRHLGAHASGGFADTRELSGGVGVVRRVRLGRSDAGSDLDVPSTQFGGATQQELAFFLRRLPLDGLVEYHPVRCSKLDHLHPSMGYRLSHLAHGAGTMALQRHPKVDIEEPDALEAGPSYALDPIEDVEGARRALVQR